MSMNLDWIVEIEKDTGMELMSEKPCGTGFHGGGATSKGSAKAFHADDKKDTS